MRRIRQTALNRGARFGWLPGAAPTGLTGDFLGKARHPLLGPGNVVWGKLDGSGLVTGSAGGLPPAPFDPAYGYRWTTVTGPLYDVTTGRLATRESILSSGLHFPGTLHSPPPEIVVWAFAQKMDLSASWDGISAERSNVQAGTVWWEWSGDVPPGFVDEPSTVDDGDGHPDRPAGLPDETPWPPPKWRRYEVGDSLESPSDTAPQPSVGAVALATEAEFESGVASRSGVLDGQGDGVRTTGKRSVVVHRNDETRASGSHTQTMTLEMDLPPFAVELPYDVFDDGAGSRISITYTGIAHYYEHYRAWAAPVLVSGRGGEGGKRAELGYGSYAWLFDGSSGPDYREIWEAAAADVWDEHYVPASGTYARPMGQNRYKSSPGALELPAGWTWGTGPSVAARVREQLARVLEEEGG